MEQIFLNEKCKFYARESKGTTPQMVYCNISVNGERIVISTGTKVIPNQFSAKKQRALISNDLTELENRNNAIVNDTIAFYKTKFTDFIHWLMANPDSIADAKEKLCNFVPMKTKNGNNNKNGGKKNFKETLEYLFAKELEEEVKEGRISTAFLNSKQSYIKNFIEFLKEKNLPNDWSALSLKTYKQYSDYLVNEKKTKGKNLNISTINNNLSALKAIVKAICDRDEDKPYVDTARWNVVKKQITTSEKKSHNFVFSDEQLQKIIDLKCEGIMAVIRDLFVFGCYVGQRPSDNVRLLKGEGKRTTSDGIPVYQLLPHKTRKTDKIATVPLFNVEAVDAIVYKFKNLPEYKEYLEKTDVQRNTLNGQYIKRIFAEAGLNESYEVTKQRGNKVEKEIENQADTAHFYLSRHYFITYMCRNGVSADEVIEMTGHTSTKQINECYAHLSSEDIAKRVTSNKTIQRMAGKSVSDSRMENNAPQPDEFDSLIREIKLCKMGFYNNITSPVKSKIKETAIFNNCSIEKACDILLENLK